MLNVALTATNNGIVKYCCKRRNPWRDLSFNKSICYAWRFASDSSAIISCLSGWRVS